MEYIAFDAHKHYTLASVARPDGQLVREQRLPHERGALQQFLAQCEPGAPVAVETIGNMMGAINKTDKLDVRGLNQLQRNGTLPTVWIPPGELRDHHLEVSDLFGARGRALLRQRLALLPPCTAYATQQLLEQVENLDRQVRGFEHQMQTVFKPTPTIQLLLTLPGVGLVLAVVIALEVGSIARFPTTDKLAAYAGTTPRVHASGGKTRFGPSRPDVNRYLKWACVEAANAICLNRGRAPRRHVSRLYERVARRKGHQKAIGAVARPLAEATYWILTKQETYREPNAVAVSSTGDKRG